METLIADRRIMTRRPVQLLAECQWKNRDRSEHACAWVKDVHENGLRLESPQRGDDVEPPFRPGRQLNVRGFFYDERGEHSLAATVCWVRRTPEGGWTAGLQFTGARRPACFTDFLRVVRDGI